MKILIIAPSDLPIPDLGGGAIEALVTYVLKENEKKGLLDISVLTSNYRGLKKEIEFYRKTKFVVFKKTLFDYCKDFIIRVLYKLSGHKFCYLSPYSKFIRKYVKNNINLYDKVIYEGGIDQCLLSEGNVSKKILHVHTDLFNIEYSNSKDISNEISEVWAVSEFIKNRVNEVCNKPCKVVMNCADLDMFDSEKTNAIDRTNLGIGKEDFVILFVGRFDEGKGVKELVEAYNRCECPNSKLVIVGGHFFFDKVVTPYMKQVKELAQNNENIIFIDNIPHSEVPKYLKMTNVVVIPSKCQDAAPLVLIESQVMGIPVICTDRGGIPEYIENRGVVIKADADMVLSLSEAIELVYNDLSLRKKLTKLELNHREFFSSTRYYQDYVNALINGE